jgi:CrcB protein
MDGWRQVATQALWVGLAGFVGANARYWIGGWVQSRCGPGFPWGTFAVNVSGSFLLGLVMAIISERTSLPGMTALRLIVAVGFVGAYTTFSTLEYETLALLTTSGWPRALANILGSVAAGLAAVAAGAWLGRLA